MCTDLQAGKAGGSRNCGPEQERLNPMMAPEAVEEVLDHVAIDISLVSPQSKDI